MEQPRIIGHVVAINGFRLKVELSPDSKSSSRATPDGVQRAVSINAFLTFDIGAGLHAIGLLTDLEARESFDPRRDEELSLELMKPRRVASIQLMGTVRHRANRDWEFDSGITVLPTLDTPAEVADPEILSSIFTNPPRRNQPRSWEDGEFDHALEIGHETGDENTKVKASFNDLFSRPLAVVGNTGSGKSYTVVSLLEGIIRHQDFRAEAQSDPHIFILDINGEYANAFLPQGKSGYSREPNRIYLNGEEFCLPAWLMNGEEICEWLQASEPTQEPLLKDWWAIAKSGIQANGELYDPLQVAVSKLDSAISWLDKPRTRADFDNLLDTASQYIDFDNLKQEKVKIDWTTPSNPEWAKIQNEKKIRNWLHASRSELQGKISDRQNVGVNFAKSADSPRFIPAVEFRDPRLSDRAIDQESGRQIDQYLTTMKLRLRTRLDDRRWQSFFSFEKQNIKSFQDWMTRLGVGQSSGPRISVLDFSMLASEALPFACALLGRLLLETREMLRPDRRSRYPWVLVLEEAHNYVRPSGKVEDRGQALSRRAFERVAKEGRKFGLSLIVASQRPSEISPTIISQCANFFSHRLQNPDDIDHFRRIIPKQAQRLLDQVTVLAAGEAIVFGSALHIPARVQIRFPTREPWSATAAPFVEWATNEAFPLGEVVENWGLSADKEPVSAAAELERA
ncbi:DUF87 domain-containing protein [Candidatus Kirkpatrickella diaphorinae]|uniref:DUF87 domain-containing protein n=1 Tax=Candidatus Kirkpatrickella diaphorinae TaxID=2984322 RepID=A0ABY6GMJ3_9PROT|nr:DUF87 domain-containing protein [Candidatus Kirkpatrickella diaphorinae]UYH52093.1 DUF87 domain-containing protein [Candidatus Kirkpatrickella diaphorinae]